MPEKQSETAKQVLRGEGKRVTAQRSLVLEILESSDSHLDADEIYLRAKQRDPRVSLSTVYRTLNVLKEMGLVESRYFARGHQREVFETSATPEHFHFTCVGCGKIIEFETPYVERLRQQLRAELGIEFSHSCLCFEGYCADCVARGLAAAELDGAAVPE